MRIGTYRYSPTRRRCFASSACNIKCRGPEERVMARQLIESREPRQDVDCLAGPGAKRAAGNAMRVPVLAFVAFGPSCPFPAVGEGQEQNGLPVLAEANWLNGE